MQVVLDDVADEVVRIGRFCGLTEADLERVRALILSEDRAAVRRAQLVEVEHPDGSQLALLEQAWIPAGSRTAAPHDWQLGRSVSLLWIMEQVASYLAGEAEAAGLEQALGSTVH